MVFFLNLELKLYTPVGWPKRPAGMLIRSSDLAKELQNFVGDLFLFRGMSLHWIRGKIMLHFLAFYVKLYKE
jgi:hypothetical protein